MALMLTNIYAHSSKLYTKHHIFSSYFKCWRILWKSVDKPMNLNCAIRIGLIPIQGLKGTFSIGNLKQNIKNRVFFEKLKFSLVGKTALLVGKMRLVGKMGVGKMGVGQNGTNNPLPGQRKLWMFKLSDLFA